MVAGSQGLSKDRSRGKSVVPTEVQKLNSSNAGASSKLMRGNTPSHQLHEEKYVDDPTCWVTWMSAQQDGMWLRLRSPTRIHPTSAFALYWTAFGIVFISMCLVFIPFQLAFDYEADINGSTSQVFWAAVFPVMDVYFLFDIVVNFNTCYYVDDELRQSRKDLTKRYLTGWFTIDFLSSSSTFIVWFSSIEGLGMFRNVRILRLLRLLRLFRMLKLGKMIATLEQQSEEMKVFINYLKICGPTFAWTHLLACAWQSIGSSAEGPNWLLAYHGDDSWRRLEVEQNYLTSLYWAFVTVTTVGYGDITPQNDTERIFAVGATFVGTAVFAFIVGEIQSMVTRKKVFAIDFEHKMESVEEFMRYHRFPSALRQKVRHHYGSMWERQILFNEDAILDELPLNIRSDVAVFLRRDLILKVPFLRDAPLNLVFDLVSRLHLLVVGAGSIIVEVGDHGREMFIIDKGEVEVTLPKRRSVFNQAQPQVILGEGDFFGEKALLEACVRTATVKATRACELLVLSAMDLGSVLEKNPVVAKHVIESLRLHDRDQKGEEDGYQSVTLWQAKKIVHHLQRKDGEADDAKAGPDDEEDDEDEEEGTKKANPGKKKTANVLVKWEDMSDDEGEDSDKEEGDDKAQNGDDNSGEPQPPETSPEAKAQSLSASFKNEVLEQKIVHLQEELQLVQRQQKRTEAVQEEQIERMMDLLRKEGIEPKERKSVKIASKVEPA